MRKPNFFIIGAPKCGTTSLAAYLSEHPNVYMSPIKEPHFFNTDMRWHDIDVPNRDAYMDLFRAASSEHLAIGEASTTYLYSAAAVPNILQCNPDAKFIVMVRNPLEMAQALHGELLWSQNENVEDFERAWYLQSDRKEGKYVPKRCLLPEWLQYRDVCKVGDQLERLYSWVTSGRIHVIVHDDLRVDMGAVYRRTLQFLEVPDNGKHEFKVYNQSKKARWPVLARSVSAICRIKHGVETKLGVKSRFGLLAGIERLNVAPHARQPLSPSLRNALLQEFRADVLKLSRLTQRDLSGWVDGARSENPVAA